MVLLWINVHNMRLGCGLEVRLVRGRRYLYFWSYRTENGRSRRQWKYLGPAGNEATRRRALVELAAYYGAARGDLDRKLNAITRRLTGF